MTDKIMELAKKLYALSERGVGGEAENAKAHLEKICAKHGISTESLTGEVREWREFEIESEQMKMLFQIHANVTGDGHYKQLSNSVFYMLCTEAEQLEIKCKLDFYWPIWQLEVERLYIAFIQKQKLFAKTNPNEQLSREAESNLKGRDIMKVMSLMNSMDEHSFQKRIDSHPK